MASWWVRTLSSRGCITQISGLCRSWAMKRGWTKRFVCFVFTLGGVISCFFPSTKDGVEFWWKMFEMFRFITLDCFTTISLYGFPMSFWDSAWIPEKTLLPMKYVVLEPRQEALEIWFEYVQDGLSDSITGYGWDSKDLTRDEMNMLATPPNPKHHNVGFPYFPASSNDLPLGVGVQVFGPYCFNSFALVFPTCEASDCRDIARYCERCA